MRISFKGAKKKGCKKDKHLGREGLFVKFLKGYHVGLFSLGFLVFINFAFSAEVKIGYVDMQAAIQKTSTGKKAKKHLESLAKKKEAELNTREKELKNKGEEFKKKASIYEESIRRKKQLELQKEFYELNQLLGQSQAELRKKEEEALKPIVDIIRQEIDKIAKKEDYTLILERSENLVLFAKKELDLTDRVVKAYEKNK